jgi:hypothetical protein
MLREYLLQTLNIIKGMLDSVNFFLKILKQEIELYAYMDMIKKLTMFQTQLQSKNKYKIECRTTQTSDNGEGRIRCHGGVSILC